MLHPVLFTVLLILAASFLSAGIALKHIHTGAAATCALLSLICICVLFSSI